MMNTARQIAPVLAFLAWWIPAATGGDAVERPDPERQGSPETAVLADGRRLNGRITGDDRSGLRFDPEGDEPLIPLEVVDHVQPRAPHTDATAVPSTFRVQLGTDGRISGSLGVVNDDEVRLVGGPGGRPIRIARAGVSAVVQRSGESRVFEDAFDAIDESRWAVIGDPAIVDEPRREGAGSLRLPAVGASMTCRLSEPLGAGYLELLYHDSGRRVPDCRWFVDLTFRGPSGLEPVQAILGWDEATLAVRTRGAGPALAVQHLRRRPGWHRLVVRFHPGRLVLNVDGEELAHGSGPGGPLVEIRLASEGSGVIDGDAKPDLATFVDDFRLVRETGPTGEVAVDPSQDEARLNNGDQVFGRIRSADADRVLMAVDGRMASLAWSDVAGLHFRRTLAPADVIEGLWVHLDWQAGPDRTGGNDRVEGVLRDASGSSLTLDVPYVGTLTIPRDRLLGLRVLGRMRRLVLDSWPHHLGNSENDGLVPPQPEGGELDIPFDLDGVPEGAPFLAVDVVQVVGVSGNLDFSELVEHGQLRTYVLLNGARFGDLNSHVRDRNEEPRRIRLAIPPGWLRPGRNVLRFEQTGTIEDPARLDNLGVLGIALEFTPLPAPTVPAIEAPSP